MGGGWLWETKGTIVYRIISELQNTNRIYSFQSFFFFFQKEKQRITTHILSKHQADGHLSLDGFKHLCAIFVKREGTVIGVAQFVGSCLFCKNQNEVSNTKIQKHV